MSAYRPTERMQEAMLTIWRDSGAWWAIGQATWEALERRDLAVIARPCGINERAQLTASGASALRKYWAEIADQVLDAHHGHALTINPRGLVTEIAAGPDGIRTRIVDPR